MYINATAYGMNIFIFIADFHLFVHCTQLLSVKKESIKMNVTDID